MVCRRVRIVQCLCWFQQSLFGDAVCGDISSRPCPSVYLLLRCLPILSESERFFFLIFCLKSSLGDFKKLTGFDFFVKILLALFCPVLAKNVPKTGFFSFFEKCYLWYLQRWHFSVKKLEFKKFGICHCVKSVQIWSYFWSVFFCIRTECRKIRTKNNSVFGHFSHSKSQAELKRKW